MYLQQKGVNKICGNKNTNKFSNKSGSATQSCIPAQFLFFEETNFLPAYSNPLITPGFVQNSLNFAQASSTCSIQIKFFIYLFNGFKAHFFDCVFNSGFMYIIATANYRIICHGSVFLCLTITKLSFRLDTA